MATSTRIGQARNRSTTLGMTASTWSISSSVVVYPRENRTADLASAGAEAHGQQHVARLDGTAGTRRARRRAHALVVEEHEELLLVDTGDAEVAAVGDLRRPVGRSPTPARTAVSPTSVDRSRQGRRRADRAVPPTRATVPSRSSVATRRAAAMPTMPATSWVPGRRPRSWAPPCSTGAEPRPGAHDRARPPPWDPRTCGRSPTRGRPPAASAATSSQPTAATASVCSSAPGGERRAPARPPRPAAAPSPPRC